MAEGFISPSLLISHSHTWVSRSKAPRVVELLRKANEWKALLESGKVASQAEIASREGVTRARVTQIMGMLKLAPLIQEKIFTSPGTLHSRPVTERMLRPIGAIANQHEQVQEFNRLSV